VKLKTPSQNSYEEISLYLLNIGWDEEANAHKKTWYKKTFVP